MLAGVAVAGLLLVTGCGGTATSTAAGPAPAAGEGVEGRLSFFGALPGDTSSGVLVLDLATGQQVRVGDQQEVWSAAWAGPKRLAVVRGVQRIRDDGPGQLVLAAADGSDEGTPIGGVADVLEVASSAGGEHLAFLGRTAHSSGACLDPASSPPMGLYVSAADGSGTRRVTDVPTASHSLALSPDGRTAVVLDHGDDTAVPAGRDWCNPGEDRFVLVDTATGASRVVTGMPAFAGTPRFSPDGATVVVDGGDSGQSDRDLVFVDVATATAQRVVTPDVVETEPVYSPDGRQLAVLRHTAGEDPATTAAIAVGDADGTGLRDVVATGTQDHGLAWTPGGTHLVLAGAVVTMDCDGCDTATSTGDVRIVSASGGDLRRVSDVDTGFEDGFALAP